MINQKRLKELLNYSPDTGLFTWKQDRTCGKGHNVVRRESGSIAGNPMNTGYLQIMLNRKTYLCHRLAWLYMTGSWPSGYIDHINGNKTDNRFINLRDVSKKTNSQNRRHGFGATGLLGVSRARKGKYRATITINGKTKHVGTFCSAEEAHEHYLNAKRKWHEGCTL